MGNKTERKNWYRDPLPMPIGEIVQEYRTAKNPNKMIDILADMNDTNPVRIAWILNRCGMTVDPKKMPRAPRSECEEAPQEYWAKSNDAVECYRIRQRFEALEAEREQKAREEAQSMPGFDEPDMTMPEVLKPYPAGAVEPGKTGCAEEKETEREGEAVAAERMFETDSQFIKRVTEEYGVPADQLANMIEEPDGIARRREILADAAVCVCTDRNMLYGELEDSFGMIARLWEGYLGIPVTENDVVDLMILMKVARNGTAKVRCRDTYVDIAGYAACGGGGIEA